MTGTRMVDLSAIITLAVPLLQEKLMTEDIPTPMLQVCLETPSQVGETVDITTIMNIAPVLVGAEGIVSIQQLGRAQ